ncbi:unnamed protein product [Zymoseptoria tritici ST99CH_3D7]|uniref:Uncharacterized protein n=1 Tax=Zymoseptoria tritici (strain ST99CH_3D7) TaxID=1276538 RepID=A0A1X7RV66_ZYMT9|nr:unnamed protein product [Zymoseptoria tritici ST99CH_3D7]
MEAHLPDAVNVFDYQKLLARTTEKLWQELRESQRAAGGLWARMEYAERRLGLEDDEEDSENEEDLENEQDLKNEQDQEEGDKEREEDKMGEQNEQAEEEDADEAYWEDKLEAFRSQYDFEMHRSIDLCEQISAVTTRTQRAKDLLEATMDQLIASARSFFDRQYDIDDEHDACRNTEFRTHLAMLMSDHWAYNEQREFARRTRKEFLTKDPSLSSHERRRVRERHNKQSTIEVACRENFERKRTDFLEGAGRTACQQMKCKLIPRGLLTEQNMAIMVPERKIYPMSQRSFESDRDSQTGRPTLQDEAYVAAPPQLSQETQNLYRLRRKFKKAEAEYRDDMDKVVNTKAYQMGIFDNLPEEYYSQAFAAELDQTPEEFEAELRESMETTREAYHEARRAIRQDLDQLPAVSESSFAARTSDYIENGSAPGSYKRRIQRPRDPALYNWQRAAASEISANGQRESPSEPSSLYNGPSLRVGERVSPSVRSDYTEARKYRVRRKKWMRRKRASVTSRRS